MKPRQTLLLLTIIFMAILACNLPSSPAATGLTFTPTLHITSTAWSTASITPTPTASPIPPITGTPSPIPISTNTSTDTPTATQTITSSPVPTYQVLRGEVIADNVVCHYGPGAAYLYKYGLVKGSHLEVIGRVEQGNYLEVQSIGGNNPCWVNPDWMKVTGDMASLRPVIADETNLPLSRRYKPPASVSAKRNGNSVTVMWAPVILRAGDDSGAAPYLIEAWVCQAGQIVFSPTGWRQTSAVITDETGCDSHSHARLYAVEKHGYTLWVEIPWPPLP